MDTDRLMIAEGKAIPSYKEKETVPRQS